ncbi:hypothetical protein BCR34DRAFT_90911 [Clohesyomyces aquaticus]|uniref:Uncharacterized protein n=1 Tax=Clohesyomyces aquaticus TaxID=1231657 RepID=A0A1Y1YUM7_9PLEO|nr:hypothetical protein BCR34DRAFT_90911 [Clohesyomyces aquaticus]
MEDTKVGNAISRTPKRESSLGEPSCLRLHLPTVHLNGALSRSFGNDILSWRLCVHPQFGGTCHGVAANRRQAGLGRHVWPKVGRAHCVKTFGVQGGRVFIVGEREAETWIKFFDRSSFPCLASLAGRDISPVSLGLVASIPLNRHHNSRRRALLLFLFFYPHTLYS